MATNSIKLLTGNSHPVLAELVAERYVRDIFLQLQDEADDGQMQQGHIRRVAREGLDTSSTGARCAEGIAADFNMSSDANALLLADSVPSSPRSLSSSTRTRRLL